MNKNIAIIFYIAITLLLVSLPGYHASGIEDPILTLIKRAEREAESQREEALYKSELINTNYKSGKYNYIKGKYKSAIGNFKKVLEVEPNYEPAMLYLRCTLIQHKLIIEEDKIYDLKFDMADIISEYDVKIEEFDGLAFTYLLEQALLRVQSGNYRGAEYYYDLCYKLDPASKVKISWFVDATYELEDISNTLDEHYKRIEELPELDLEELAADI